MRGLEMMSRSLPDLAVAEFTQAIKLDPADASGYANRGGAYISLKQMREARTDLEKSLNLDPGNYFALSNLGFLELRERRFPEAVDLLKRSLEIQDGAGARAALVDAYFQQGDYAHALPELERLTRQEPKNIAAYMRRATALLRLDRDDELPALAQEVLAAKAGPGEGALAASEIYRLLGDPDQANAVLEEGTRKAPSADLYLGRAVAAKDDSSARPFLQAALKLEPRNEFALALLAKANVNLKDYRAAMQNLDQLEAVMQAAAAPTPAIAFITRGEALTGLGDAAGASRAYASARALTKSGSEFNSLCWAQATANVSLEEALKDCDAALALLPECGPCHDSRGFVLLRLKRYDESIASYDASLSRRPDQAMSLYGRGIAKLRLGRKAEGEADMAAATKLSPRAAAEFQSYGISR
jgi:tetratricopeptide (TPR) repeat protein